MKPRPQRLWTEEEIIYLKTFYPTCQTRGIARKLQRTLSAVQTKARRLKVEKETFSVSLSKTEAAYIAGLTDGEGSIGIHRHNGTNWIVNFRVAMCHRETIEWLRKAIGVGAVYPKKRYSDRWNVEWFYHLTGSERVKVVLEQILPFLKTKKEQCKIALAWCRIHDRHNRGKSYSPSDFEMIQRIRILNKRGT